MEPKAHQNTRVSLSLGPQLLQNVSDLEPLSNIQLLYIGFGRRQAISKQVSDAQVSAMLAADAVRTNIGRCGKVFGR